MDELLDRLRYAQAFAETPGSKELYADAISEIETLTAALRPFGADDYEHPVADENGWTDFGLSWCRERIVDWFGPSEFREAATALRARSGEHQSPTDTVA